MSTLQHSTLRRRLGKPKQSSVCGTRWFLINFKLHPPSHIEMSAKPQLSKGVLQMKFMKRTKDKVDEELAALEGRTMYSNEITDRMMNDSSNFIIEPSFMRCEDLIDGRLSFRGMNPEIERLLELEEEERQAKTRHEMGKDVTDQEMVDYYGNVVQTISRKFDTHRKRKGNREESESKPMKFLKPKDED